MGLKPIAMGQLAKSPGACASAGFCEPCEAELLVVDEAAAIPLPIVKKLLGSEASELLGACRPIDHCPLEFDDIVRKALLSSSSDMDIYKTLWWNVLFGMAPDPFPCSREDVPMIDSALWLLRCLTC